MTFINTIPLPLQDILESATPHTAQVGGHPTLLCAPDSGLIVKPALPAERAFYDAISQLTDSEFPTFLPRYYGSLTRGSTVEVGQTVKQDGGDYLVMEDVCEGFVQPCVMDIKIGQQIWSDDASPEKKARMLAKAKEGTSAELGMRIVGMRVWDPQAEAYTVYDREYGYQLTRDTLPQAMRSYFAAATSSLCPHARGKAIMEGILDELVHLLEVLSVTPVRLYGASLLLVYEGDPVAKRDLSRRGSPIEGDEEEEEEEEGRARLVDARVIDFAHSHLQPDIGPDAGAILGIGHVKRLIELALQSTHLSPSYGNP
ncbi:MAG: hypothetical protein DHS80DRAFT_19039 [Piptocephalis tieghemiana]|nr:MAG: hypothetical protein DHS80DRAFT_19039 [Piptocephalis tieghemiana]